MRRHTQLTVMDFASSVKYIDSRFMSKLVISINNSSSHRNDDSVYNMGFFFKCLEVQKYRKILKYTQSI